MHLQKNINLVSFIKAAQTCKDEVLFQTKEGDIRQIYMWRENHVYGNRINKISTRSGLLCLSTE